MDEQVDDRLGRCPHAPPHTGKFEDTTPLVAGDGIDLRCARQRLGHVRSTNKARQAEITTRGVVLQRVLDALYL